MSKTFQDFKNGDAEEKVAEIVRDHFTPRALVRYGRGKDYQSGIDAMLLKKIADQNEIREKKEAVTLQYGRAERENRTYGGTFKTTNKDGRQETTRDEKWRDTYEKPLAELRQQSNALATKRLPPSPLGAIHEGIIRHGARPFIDADLPTLPRDRPANEVLESGFKGLAAAETELKRIVKAPKTLAEVEAETKAMVARLVGTGTPLTGVAFRGGRYRDRTGEFIAENTDTLEFPQRSLGFLDGNEATLIPDMLAIAAWLDPEKFEARCLELVRSRANDTKAIPLADKPALIAKAKMKVVSAQRFLMEAIFRAEDERIQVEWPADFPMAIYLGTEI